MHLGFLDIALIICIVIIVAARYRSFDPWRTEIKNQLDTLELGQRDLASRLGGIEHDVQNVLEQLREKEETLEEQWLQGKLPS